ncbi:SseB family protein [Frigoribacterium faeni]|uniref:SseB protein N-terminal domain-containing protein n=1 Tax=Frigoribacterium faeni TaxID=145483 RepID=A0A7W3JHU9_9MICO|nr:SseB family protein [Frigoribacterium faeni]MBA8813098.1 hypothetical protein [Frigoribacterium faeni]GEK83402.1 hypothetical protein FFA01_17110 [Frigoribacterium faeni]
MGIFSRKKHTSAADTGEARGDTPTPSPGPQPIAPEAPGAPDGVASAPAVPAPATPAAPETPATDASAPPVPEHRAAAPVVHTSLQEALAGWGEKKNIQTMYSVIKELAAGDLLLDIGSSSIADPTVGPQKGDTISIAHQVDNNGKKVLLAFTSGDRLGFYRKTPDPVSLVESAPAVVAMATSKYDGLVLDPGSPETQWIGYTDELVTGLTDDPAENTRVKRAMAERRIPWITMLEMLRDAPALYIAALEEEDDEGVLTSAGVATVTSNGGDTYSVLLTSPAEVGAWAPTARARATRLDLIAKVAIDRGHAGIVVNPAGSMLTVTVDELRALLASA